MRILLTAFALTFALPAAAQTASTQPNQASSSHAEHGQHGQHGQHHDEQQGQSHGPHHGQGCCADADGNGHPDCCDRMNHGQHGARSGADAPSGAAPQDHRSH